MCIAHSSGITEHGSVPVIVINLMVGRQVTGVYSACFQHRLMAIIVWEYWPLWQFLNIWPTQAISIAALSKYMYSPRKSQCQANWSHCWRLKQLHQASCLLYRTDSPFLSQPTCLRNYELPLEVWFWWNRRSICCSTLAVSMIKNVSLWYSSALPSLVCLWCAKSIHCNTDAKLFLFQTRHQYNAADKKSKCLRYYGSVCEQNVTKPRFRMALLSTSRTPSLLNA